MLTLLVALTVGFAPIVGVAMAKSCTMTSEMTTDNASDCYCHDSMPNCGAMPQCRSAAGCASQCFNVWGVLPTMTGQIEPDHDFLKIGANADISSLSIKPPSPPPRA